MCMCRTSMVMRVQPISYSIPYMQDAQSKPVTCLPHSSPCTCTHARSALFPSESCVSVCCLCSSIRKRKRSSLRVCIFQTSASVPTAQIRCCPSAWLCSCCCLDRECRVRVMVRDGRGRWRLMVCWGGLAVGWIGQKRFILQLPSGGCWCCC